MHLEPIKVEDAKREIEEIGHKLKKMEELSKRKTLLENYLMILEHLNSPSAGSGSLPNVLPSSFTESVTTVVPKRNNTQQLAHKILSAHGSPMHMDDLIPAMREGGWSSSGDDTVDENRVYAAMHRRTDLFQKTKASTWKAKVKNLEKTG
jgi:hypothetical protein